MLWTAKSPLNTLLPPAAKSVYSAPQFDCCRSKLHLRLSIQTTSNRPECELFSTRLNYWVAAGAVGDGCLNQWPLRCLLFTRLDAALFFPVGTILQAFWISSFLFVWQNIFDSDVLSGWGRAAAFQTLNANVYFISDSTMMLFPCIFLLFFSSV